jgi:probable O-glycosylation ligase (exosortase A-associated)
VRDLILLAALAGVVPLIFRAPQVGILTWIWVTLLNPQREVYGFLSDFQLNLYIALITAVAWAISRERKTVPLNSVTGLMILFGVWTCITTYFALDVKYSTVIWERVIKTLILALAILAIANSKVRIQSIVWVLCLSLGYYSVKGGAFVLGTGGSYRVLGPEDSMIEDNNSIALAMVMLLPLLNYLRITTKDIRANYILLLSMGLTLIAIIGTYSRGALVALAASGVAYIAKSRSSFIPLVMAGCVLAALPSFMPAGWFERMTTIQSYDQDDSFAGRVAAWKTSVAIATQRPATGGGFFAVDLNWVAQAYRIPGSQERGRAAHSIYFEVLGDHGFIGLALFLMLFAAAWLNASAVLRATRDDPGLDWANKLARAIQVSMVGFAVGGALLSMAYYDGFLILLALSGSLVLTVRQASKKAAPNMPRWKISDDPVAGEAPIGAMLPGWGTSHAR